MAQSFGRRPAPTGMAGPRLPPPPRAAAVVGDPRMHALAASVRAQGGDRGVEDELRDYARRRQAAIGPWRRLAYALAIAPPAAAYLLGVHGLWLAPISAASLVGPPLLKRARLRWAAELATGSPPPAS